MAAKKAKQKTEGSTTASVKGILDEIEWVLKVIERSNASPLKKKRATLLLTSILGLIKAFCLAGTPLRDLAPFEFEVPRSDK